MAGDPDEQAGSTRGRWAAVTTAMVMPWGQPAWKASSLWLQTLSLALLPLLLQTSGAAAATSGAASFFASLAPDPWFLAQIQMVEPGLCNRILIS